jgi:hypothetical protein
MSLQKVSIIAALFTISFLAAPTASGNIIIDKLRPQGSKRIYEFYIRDQKFGRLESEARGKTSFEGNSGYKFDEKLELDFTPFGNQYKMKVKREHYIRDDGFYLGDRMDIAVNEEAQEIKLLLKNNTLGGFLERNGVRESINMPLESDIFCADNYMIDQYELFLAQKKLAVGDSIMDTIFIPQAMIKAPVKIIIESFLPTRFGNLADSTFVCHFIEPSDQIAYVTKDKKIVRINQPSQGISAVLIEDPLAKFKMPSKSLTLGGIVKRTPLYILYLAFGILLSSPFLWRHYRNYGIYAAIILAAAAHNLLKITHIPLQEWYTTAVIIPGMKAGGSIYAYAIVSALFVGIIQEIVKFIPIILLYNFARKSSRWIMIIGLSCGLGFGVYDAGALTGAAYEAGTMKILSWPIFERLIWILFHITAGALIGFGLSKGIKSLTASLVGAMAIHALASFLIVFVQKRLVDFAVFEIIQALIVLLFLMAVYLFIRKSGLSS